jgi:hypothetical protein
MYTYRKTIEASLKTDVLVVGGGPASATAAIAAARRGLEVVLIERYGFLGGISTTVLDTICGFYVPEGDQSRKIVGGIPDQILMELRRHNACLVRQSGYRKAGDVITYNPAILKVVWETLGVEAGVKVLYHTFAADALIKGNRLRGAVVVGKGGWLKIEAKVTIDASGDADLAAAAGAPFEIGPDLQVMSATFWAGNVDMPAALKISKDDLTALLADAVARGSYQLPVGGGSYSLTTLPAVMAVNMVRIGGLDPTDPWELTQAEIEGRTQIMEYHRFLKDCVPGFENSYITNLSTQVGVRESRRILGDYRLSRKDILEGRRFSDGIALCAWPLEDHRRQGETRLTYVPDGKTYSIPYRCLLPQGLDGLLVAGRSLSADHDAHTSARVMAQCMAMGQAAGTAAGLAILNGGMPREIESGELRAQLKASGAIL